MNKHEILEKTLGEGIVALTKEVRRAARKKQEIHLQLADSLRKMFGVLRRARRGVSDPWP